jgi:hypothetical protein
VEEWQKSQLPAEVYTEGLRAVGFEASCDSRDFTVDMPAKEWFSMVRARFWSCFHPFSDEELGRGIEEIRSAWRIEDEEATIRFPDRFAFIVGVKPSSVEVVA